MDQQGIEVQFHPDDAIEQSEASDDDDGFFEDSTTNYDGEEEAELIETPSKRRKRRSADKATKAVWCTKALVLIVLVLSAATSASLTYVFLEGDEHEDFERTVSLLQSRNVRFLGRDHDSLTEFSLSLSLSF